VVDTICGFIDRHVSTATDPAAGVRSEAPTADDLALPAV